MTQASWGARADAGECDSIRYLLRLGLIDTTTLDLSYLHNTRFNQKGDTGYHTDAKNEDRNKKGNLLIFMLYKSSSCIDEWLQLFIINP